MLLGSHSVPLGSQAANSLPRLWSLGPLKGGVWNFLDNNNAGESLFCENKFDSHEACKHSLLSTPKNADPKRCAVFSPQMPHSGNSTETQLKGFNGANYRLWAFPTPPPTFQPWESYYLVPFCCNTRVCSARIATLLCDCPHACLSCLQ